LVVVAVLGGVVVTLGATLLFGWGATAAAVVVVGACWVLWLGSGSSVLAGTGFGHSVIAPTMAAMASTPPTPISGTSRRRGGGGSTGGRS
jgi:hypothetical protein